MADGKPTLAVLGGTGKEGSGLAARWAAAGYEVVIGGRDAGKAEAAAAELAAAIPGANVRGADNAAAAAAGEIVVLTVPYAAQQATALAVKDALAGKILVDVTVPLVPPKVNRVQLPEGGSAAMALQAALGEGVRVVSAFQNISAHHLHDLDHELDCDVLVAGDDIAAREAVIALAEAAKLRGFHAGPLCNSVVTEALTSVLISINQRYKVPSAGIRITGLPG
ncbi:NADPH-dependent F420 reductase [Edaphosphingomonas haloaromaticamans]|uniref:NADP oxidoreductase coenzyme F420-dependent n=1 Tax=Edaphosphingomonas haloaromaticamans TaxID=653954 RepID=A0A1S1HEM7_9SPHN|nr:NADPH-dependent F420 reductase [Sphingomonas haloaromaticamans]OHT19981.1 NADP oxidoreductase coenzyme F420-dependent [Sphingomonas haloaromaticamans]